MADQPPLDLVIKSVRVVRPRRTAIDLLDLAFPGPPRGPYLKRPSPGPGAP